MKKIWRVNTREKIFKIEDVPNRWERLGGRALLSSILVDEVDAHCNPLGHKNKLIFAPGLLVGYNLSSCDRISIGGKSPLTGGVKESNAGGRTGLQIVRLGIKALIIEEKPLDESWTVLHVSKEGVRFESGEELAGLGVYETSKKLIEIYGEKVAIAMIGPAGEMELSAAGIQNLDKDKAPSRIAARGGMGAVMGSKGIKAIIIDGSEGEKPKVADGQGLKEARKAYTKALLGHPQTQVYKDYGTAALTMMVDTFGALPTRNFSSGTFEGAENLSGEKMRENLLDRGGDCDPSHPCMVGCAIQSSNIYVTLDKGITVSPLEYETIGLMGSNLGIADMDFIAKLNYEVNDLGMDSIEVGAALGVAADAGILKFGDGERVLELLDEIRAGSPLGRILGNGAAITGKVLGVERVPVAKGQAFSAYDPRAIKGTGITYATSPQGADHTCGLTIRANVDHRDPKGQKELSLDKQLSMAGFDSLGACIFAGFGYGVDENVIPSLLNAIYGWEEEVGVLKKMGQESLTFERKFNKLAGFTKADDRLPEWVTREQLPPFNSVFDVSESDLDSVFEWEDK
ncbi:MAG: aldehyde ferredoxin oxidoreductase [Chloroflexi bacterium]|nr:aldehyde ferredoxin oxidoreductase [Chloroflexota bacterium]MBT4754784.1 aldehyde ferredoxin oxidoreductase [Chloroflexota bacterium]MBT6358782.1 aldehyde ferredoxin oxidoreductase [Chloroflexota bacterium]MBT6989917.1 aldehyde ferredoxin oxidoreductase [Chloroflexota bacterium]MBT7216883.1 aldehyde ferredoxin oxidoreductase [Chloroflexota bacterium]